MQREPHTPQGGEEMHEAERTAVEQELWNKQDAAVKVIGENPVEFFAKFSDKLYAPRTEYVITCVDDRVRTEAGQGRIAIAGSGVLQNEAQMRETTSRIKAEQLPIIGVTRHSGCGAEGLASKQMPEDELSKKAPQLAKLLGTDFIGMAPMLPTKKHVARAVLVSDLKFFNPDVFADELTPLYISKYYSPTAIEDAVISVSIALGDHNFSPDFTKDNPLLVVIAGDGSSDTVKAELQKALANNPLTADNIEKIKLVGYDKVS